jgi:hypothetical protein
VFAQSNGRSGVPRVEVVLPANLRQELDLYISQCRYEISGLGTVELRNGRFEVTGIHLLDQEVNEIATKLPQLAVASFIASAPEHGIARENIRLWWHSHATYDVGWSGDDEIAIQTFSAGPWCVSIVGNHDGEYKARVDFFPGGPVPLRLMQPAWLVTQYPEEEVRRARTEIKRHVRKNNSVRVVSAGRSTSRRAAKKK